MDGVQVLETILPRWREAVALDVGAAWFDAFIGEHRPRLVQELDRWVERMRRSRVARVAERTPARRILDRRADLITFDVGVGMTYTALAALALNRFDRQPFVFVPHSVAGTTSDAEKTDALTESLNELLTGVAEAI